MLRKHKKIWILLIVLAALMLHRFAWIYWPSQGEVTFHVQETGETTRETLTSEETMEVKKLLAGHIRWPEWLYGYPACGFGEMFSITIDGVCYMPAWDGCTMVAVKDILGTCKYMDVTEQDKEILVEIITSRGE